MSFLPRIASFFLDFLFPKKKSVVTLENLSTSELLRILPPAKLPEENAVLALFEYGHPIVREMIWELKYKGNLVMSEKFSEILSDVIVQELSDKALFEKFDSPLLIPVPISEKRRFERGWNQAELLCKAMKRNQSLVGIKYAPRQLVKYRHTESQTKTQSKHERTQNLRDSMKVLNPQAVRGHLIILVDDVVTTGSTMAEARRA